MISFLYTQIFYRPVLNALAYFAGALPGGNLGIAIFIVTVFVRVIIFPMQQRMIRTQQMIQTLAPEIAAIKKKCAGKRDEESRAIMELYRTHHVNPFSGMLSMLFIQLPIFIALFQVFRAGFTPDITQYLYAFVSYPENLQTTFLGLSLTAPSVLLALLAGATQYIQIALSPAHAIPKKETGDVANASFANEFQRALKVQTKYVIPVMIVVIGARFPAALTLYWTVSNVFAIVQEGFVRFRVKASPHGTRSSS